MSYIQINAFEEGPLRPGDFGEVTMEDGPEGWRMEPDLRIIVNVSIPPTSIIEILTRVSALMQSCLDAGVDSSETLPWVDELPSLEEMERRLAIEEEENSPL